MKQAILVLILLLAIAGCQSSDEQAIGKGDSGKAIINGHLAEEDVKDLLGDYASVEILSKRIVAVMGRRYSVFSSKEEMAAALDKLLSLKCQGGRGCRVGLKSKTKGE